MYVQIGGDRPVLTPERRLERAARPVPAESENRRYTRAVTPCRGISTPERWGIRR